MRDGLKAVATAGVLVAMMCTDSMAVCLAAMGVLAILMLAKEEEE